MDPLRWLAPLGATAARPLAPAPVPTPDEVEEWHQRLRRNRKARRYLRSKGLDWELVKRHRIGWDGSHVVLPVFGRRWVIVNALRVRPGQKARGLRGRGSQLYPHPPREDSFVVLVAGVWDALLLRQHDLPAVSTTTGASLPEHLREAFSGCRVAVVYDVGEECAATRTARQLVDAGAAEAWSVALPLPDKGDDTSDWFVKYELTANELLRRIRRARRTQPNG